MNGDQAMRTTHDTASSASLERRIDAMRLGAIDTARAKASLRNADRLVDFGFAVAAAVRASAAFVRRQMKSAFVSSPQH
jgi:hypothetical protein